MSFDWFCRHDDEELPPLPGRPESVSRLRKKISTPAVVNIAALAGAQPFVPVGPSAALFGATVRRAAVAGRVRALSVSDDGQRVYAGTAGGLWYSADAGTTWTPLDADASTRALDGDLHDARALAVSALSVQFGAAADGADDVVFAGTGDPALESGIGPDGARGIGIRTAVGPAGNGAWALEAKNLAGAVVLAIARDRAGDIWAATTDGLYKRPAANRDEWERIFEGLVWDLGVTRGVGAEPQRLWVASEGKLEWTADGNNFTAVALVDDFPAAAANRPPIGRIRLAAARDANPPFVWALASGARLWRVDAAGASPVDGVPDDLSGLIDADRADLGLAIACAPADPTDVIVGGGLTRTATPEPAASVYRAKPKQINHRWTFAGASGGETRTPPALAGIGVPAGVHAIAFAANAQPSPHVWIATDGGVFRSRDAGGSFQSRSVGLPAFAIERFAHHERAEGLLVGGAQTGGALRATGPETWETSLRYGGGGVVLDPADGNRIAVQRRGAAWLLSSDGRAFAPVRWFNAPSGSSADIGLAYDTANREEDRNSAPVSTPAATVAANGATQLAIGTRRVWYSEDWGGAWRTLPTINQDPSALDAAGRGPRTEQDLVDAELRVLRWGTADQLYALTGAHLFLYRRAAAAWTKRALYDGPSLKPKKRKSRGNQIPPEMPLTDLVLHDAAAAPHGTLYVTTARSFENDDERHVWWFDGNENWYQCGLDVAAPAYALAIDPAHRERVFVGTAVGVYRGVFQAPANAGDRPRWDWSRLSAGLPEAPCIALSVHDGARLLRASIWGRGVFEMQLDGVAAEGDPLVFLRAHELDWRRSAIAAQPLGPFPAPGTVRPYAANDYGALPLDASPDIRVRRAPGEPPTPFVSHRSAFAEGTAEPRTFVAYAIEAALRRAGDAVVPVSGIEDASFAPAVERRLQRSETNTAAGWNELNERGALGNIVPVDAPLAFRGTAAAALPPTRTLLGVAGNPFAGRNLAGLLLRFSSNAVSEVANRNAATIITANTDNTLTFLPLPASVAANDPFEIEESAPGSGAAAASIVNWPDPGGIRSCRTHGGPTLVDVVVRMRSGANRTIAGNRVRVALLRAPIGGGGAVADLPNGWVNSLRNDVAQPAANRGAWLPADWHYFNDASREILPLPRALDGRNPGVVTFKGSLAADAMLLAVVLADDDMLNTATVDVVTLARQQRHIALRSVRVVAEPVVKNHAFYDWHTSAANNAAFNAPAAPDRRLVRADADGRLRPKTRLHLCFLEQAVASFEVTLSPGNWDASWSIVDSAGNAVARHPNFPAAGAAIANGSYAWKWDGRRDAAAPRRGRVVLEGLYRSRLVIRAHGAAAPVFEYIAEILAEGKPYHIFVEGVPKNDAEMTTLLAGVDPYRIGGGAAGEGQRRSYDCWIQVYRGQKDEGHCVFLGEGTIEATDVTAGAIGGAVATPHDREYKGTVRRDPHNLMANADRCQIDDLGGVNINLRNPRGLAPNNPYVNNPPTNPGAQQKTGVQTHGGSITDWTFDDLSVGCTGVKGRPGVVINLGSLHSLSSQFGTWGGAGENAAMGGPEFRNKQSKRAAATAAQALADALVPDDHSRPVLDPPAFPAGTEPLHMQDTFQKGAFGGFLQGELPITTPTDEPAPDGSLAPQARIRCVLRDYRRGSKYHIYHHAVIAKHEAVANAANFNIIFWVPRKVIRGWNSPIPADDHAGGTRATFADRRHHDPLPENRRNLLVPGNLQVRWFVRHTAPAGGVTENSFGGGAAPAFAALVPGRSAQINWARPAAAGIYESVCEYRLQLEPQGGAHEWHPEMKITDTLSVSAARMAAETLFVDGAGVQHLAGSSTIEIFRI